MKNVTVFYYDEFAEFEIVLALLVMRGKTKVSTVALEKRNYLGEEMQWYCNDNTIEDVDPSKIDLLLIPGGDSRSMYENMKLKGFIEKVVEGGGKVAGICGGAVLLTALGLMDGRRCTGSTSGISETDESKSMYEKALLVNDEHVVVDGPFITGQGQAYAEFAVEVARQMGIVTDDADFSDTLKWLKNDRT